MQTRFQHGQGPHQFVNDCMEHTVKKKFLLCGLLAALGTATELRAQTGYSQTDLVSNTAGIATTTDPQLLNPWGISFLAGQDFWIANNNGGTSTLYDAQGAKNALVVTIPGATMNPNGNCTPGCPTGTVSNANGSYFSGGTFIFDTEDGLIVSWTGGATATVAFDNSASGAVYKGLAMVNSTFLLAANFNSGKIDVYDRNFRPASLGGSFIDPNLPAGYAPDGIHVIGNHIYVAYAMQDAAKHDSKPGAGLGQVDIFDLNGNFLSTFVAAGGKLNAPWAVVETPSTFGSFPNAILVGNFGDGTIDAYDLTGTFLGQLTDPSNNPLVNPGLWDMVFGGGGPSGDPGTLYLTAGGGNQPNFPAGGSTVAVLASVVPATAVGTPDFSLSLPSQSVTVAAGGSAGVSIGASAVGGFNGQVSLSCTAPSGVTCSFNPTMVSTGTSGSTSTLTIAAAATVPSGGYAVLGAIAFLPGLGMFGTVFASRRRRGLPVRNILSIAVLGLLLLVSSFALGCGGSAKGQTAGSQATIMITGTSGSLSHTSPLTITVQ
jgi:uncharacterized protein (TIGR03118 family)